MEARSLGVFPTAIFKAMIALFHASSETDRVWGMLARRAHQSMSYCPVSVLNSYPIEKVAKIILERRFACFHLTNPDHMVEECSSGKICASLLAATSQFLTLPRLPTLLSCCVLSDAALFSRARFFEVECLKIFFMTSRTCLATLFRQSR